MRLIGNFLCLGTLLCAAAGGGAELLKNGSFETGPAGGIPDNWHFARSGNAEAAFQLDGTEAANGKRSLLISNGSTRSPNVYGSLHQVTRLKPGVSYELTGKLKGRNAAPVLFCIGKGWNTRLRPETPGPEWQEFQLSFKLTPEQIEKDGGVPFVIITEDLTEELRLDGLELREAGPRTIPAALLQQNRLWRVDRYDGPIAGLTAIPAGLPQLVIPASPANTVNGGMPEPDGFSGRAAIAYDAKGVIFFLAAKDTTPNTLTGEQMWRGDSVQIRIDRAGKSSPNPEESDLEFGVAVDNDSRVHTWDWSSSSELPNSLIETSGKRTAAGCFAAIRLDWKLLSPLHFPDRNYFTFNIVFNSSDQPGHRDVYFLTPGLHDTKSAAGYTRALLADPARPSAGIRMADAVAPDVLRGSLVAVNLPPGVPIEAALKGADGREFRSLLGTAGTPGKGDMTLLDCKLPLNGVAEGKLSGSILAGQTPLVYFEAVKSDPVKLQSNRLDAALSRFEALKKEFKAFYGERPFSAYVSMPLAVLSDTLPLYRNRLKSTKEREAQLLHAERLAMIMPEVEAALDDLSGTLAELKSGRVLPATWRYVSGPVELKEGWPYATLERSDGKREHRPVMFDGYGHFTNMKSAFKAFPRYAANIVQLEYGPRSVFPHEGKTEEFEADFSDYEKNFRPLIDSCRENDLALCLLLSPHYAPAWWLEKHPEVKTDSGFLKYNILHPEARKMMSAHIRNLVARLRELPHPEVIHSICLQNEPIYTPDWNDAYTRQAFKAYLTRKYGSADGLNLAAGTSDKAVNAEWIAFRKQVMDNWTKFLANEVKQAWPEIPVHSKIMIMNSTFADHAIDPETFALESDYNGNDNYGNWKEGGYVSDWLNIAAGDELQLSMKPVSVINAENHIIRDAEIRPIPNEHIYAANFMQHLTGASALVTWVWVDYAPERESQIVKDLRGNIALRPGNIIAQGKAQLDAMRLAPELLRFSRSESAVALLYSPTTLSFDPSGYKHALYRLYAETAFTGHRVRFLSERQLAAGEFGSVKLLLAVGAPNIGDEAVAGIERFIRQGGRVAADRFSLKRDGRNRERRLSFTPETIPDFIKAPELRERFFESVERIPFKVTPATPGVFFRAVPAEEAGEWLIVLVNYNADPVKLKFEGARNLTDLIAEKSTAPEFELKPMQILLLRAEQPVPRGGAAAHFYGKDRNSFRAASS